MHVSHPRQLSETLNQVVSTPAIPAVLVTENFKIERKKSKKDPLTPKNGLFAKIPFSHKVVHKY